MLRSTKNTKIIMKKNVTSCTINEVTREDEGTYMVKATSEVGENITKGTLLCHELTESEMKALQKRLNKEAKMKKLEADRKRVAEEAKENAKKNAQRAIEQAEIDRKKKMEDRKQAEIRKKEERILAEKRREEEIQAAQQLKLKKAPTTQKKAPVDTGVEDEFVKTKHILKKTEIAERKLESAQQLSWNLKKREVTATEVTSKEFASANLTEVQVKEMKKTRGRSTETQEDASLSITQHSLDAEESHLVMTECHEGDKMFAICSYVAENQDALNLVEGERVYILECHNSDWWFVKKHLTEEKGWAPAQMLKTEVKYSDYVQKKLHEKIDKLPVFEKPCPGEHVSAPRFTEKLQPKNSPDGGTVTFECRVEGSPRPLITWFRQTAIIKPSPDFQIFYDENNVATLLIKEVFPEDAGMFTCVAKNAAGFASSTTELVVEAPLSDHGSELAPGHSRKSLSRESSLADILEGIPPTFAQKPRTRTVDEGQSVVLECRLVAVPEPELQWFFNGKALRESRELIISMDSDMHSYNTIVKITGVKKIHEGTYEVVAKNREGTATNQVVVKVITGAKEAPQILEPLKSLAVTEGDSVILSTQIIATPKPKVTWYRNGVELKPDGDNSVTKLDKDIYSLTIYHTSMEDDGDYMVSAENEVGSAQTSAILCVEELLELKPEPPMFVERFEEQRVPSKGIIRLEAKVTGNPQPEIAWFRNNKRLKPSKNITEIYDGESILLEIGCGEDGMEDGDYKCVATNSVGKASHGARVTVEADKIKFTKKLHNVEVEEGNVAKFECQTSQAVEVKWYFNNLEISTTDKSKYEIITEGKKHMLVIKKVEEYDAGQVKCMAKDQSTQATLIIRESGVEFVRKLVDFEVKEREMAMLEVEVSSTNAEVSWHKDGEELKMGDDRFEFEKEGTIRKLMIRCTSVHDEGEYTCALGEQECTAEVTVVELPPEIISRMQDVTIAKGERATFEIELTKGDALVRWFKDGAELQFSEHVQLAIDGKRQRLMVYNSMAEDEGEYSCQVGEQTSVANLKVEEPAVQFMTRLPDVTLTPLNTDAVFMVELSEPNIEVVWLRNGKPIKASDRYEISVEGCVRRLVIKNATMEDQSEYSCLAINVRTTSKLKVEIIETVPRINMDLTKKDYRVRKGEDVEITVKYSGIPQPKDEWFVNGKIIKKSKKISSSIDSSSATLTIKKVQEEDCGNLTLKLTNNCGEASAELTLIIMQSPSQPGSPEVIEVTNESVTLHWRAPEHDGNTKITNYILEYHDKVDVLSWTKVTETICETTHKVSRLQHNTEYMFRVTAVNEVGPSPPSSTSRYIRITQPGTSEPPIIQQPLTDVTSGLGVSATLQCVIGGVPEPEIKWLRDGKPFKTKTMTYENRMAKFTVSQVSETSGATFTCQAKNEAGVAETSARLIVQEKPRLETDETLLAQKLRVNNQWKIEVKFSGFPKPEISWSRDNRRLESSKKCSLYVDETSTTISIYSLTREDSGIYKVTATNSAGATSLDLNLRVIDDTVRLNKSRSPSEEPIDKPGRPEGPLVVKKIQKESVTIEWKPPADDGGLDISKYSVEKCDITKMQWMKVADVEGAITSYAIQRLNEGSEYMFRVFAANPIGYSEALESDTVVVKSQHEPPSPPRGPLDLTGMTDTSLTIKWQAPESDGGCALLEYLVERREVSKKAWQKVGSTESQHIEVTSLKLNTSYHFRITAMNEVGCSSPFAPEEAITVGKRITPPSKPTNLTVVDVTSRSVTLQWGPPASTGGTEITGYIIEKRITTSKTYEKVVTLEPSISQYCILNLKEKSEFYFRVYAENAMGLSEPAETQRVRLKTHASPPSPPTAPLETRGTGPNSIVIAWGIPESDGGAPIEGYTIAIKDTRKTMWMEVGRVKADVQKLNIRDLQEGHNYMLRIFARNEVGQSDPLESEEPVHVLRPADSDLLDVASRDGDKDHDAPSISLTTETTTSWMKETNMDADISTYARGCLLRNDEYFFKIWHNARKLFK